MAAVGIFEGEFVENKPTSNAKYFLSRWKFPQESYGKVFKVEEMPRPEITSILCDMTINPDILNLKAGQKCQLQCSVSVKQASNGYPASVGLNIVGIKVLANA